VTDYELVLDIRDGSESAFEELMRRYSGMVERACNHYYFPNADRDDVRQIGRLALWEAAQKFKPATYDWYDNNKGFAAFAKTVVYRKVISELKYATREKRYKLDIACIDSISEPMITEEVVDWDGVKSFFSTLTKIERTVLYLYMQGYEYDDISDMLDITKKSVDNALWRSRNKARLQKIGT
jgi:RNA polymerase sporulation-specific sigma factor